MALDASVFARFQPKTVADFDTEAATIANNNANNQLNALKLLTAQRSEQASKRDFENDNAFSQYVQKNAQTMQNNTSQFINDATAQGYIKQAQSLQKTLDDRAKEQSETKRRDMDVLKDRVELSSNRWGAAMRDPSQAPAVIDDLERMGIYPKEHAQLYRNAIAQDPNNAKLIANREYLGSLKAAQQLYGHTQQDTGDKAIVNAFDPVTGKTTLASEIVKGQTPDSKATDSRIAAERAAKRADDAAATAAAEKNALKPKYQKDVGMVDPLGNVTPLRDAATGAVIQKPESDKPLSKQGLAAYNMGLKELQKEDAAVASSNDIKQAYERWRDLNAKTMTGPIAGRRLISFDDDYQELKKLENYLTVNNFKPGQGAISNIERQFMKGAGPNTQNNEQTNANIVNIGLGAAQNMRDRANFKEVYLQKNNNLLGSEKVWQDYLDKNPRFIPDKSGKIVPNSNRVEWTQYFADDAVKKSTDSVKAQKTVSMEDVAHTIEDLKARGIAKTQQQVIQDLKNKGYEVK